MATNTKRIRRCHVCGTVNELKEVSPNERVAHRCDSCGKHLAPFYFFEESELIGVGDNRLTMSLWKARGSYGPVWGIFALWTDDEPATAKLGDS